MSKFTFFILALLISVSAEAQNFSWANTQAGANLYSSYTNFGIATDHHHNILACAPFSDSITIGSNQYKTAEYGDAFVVKYDSAGNVIWSKHLAGGGAFGTCNSQSIAVDGTDNVYVAGYFSCNSIYFSSTDSLVNPKQGGFYTTFFLVKYDMDGNYLWSKTATTGAFGAYGTSVTTDANNNVIIGGTFTDTITMSSVQVTGDTGSSSKFFIVKYNSSGVIQWARAASARGGYIGLTNIASDNSNNIFITGQIDSTIHIDSIISVAGSSSKVAIIKMNSNGDALWVRSYGGRAGAFSTDLGKNIKADHYGDVYISANLLDTIIGANYQYKASILKYSSDGNLRWHTELGSPNFGMTTSVSASGMSLDENGDPYVIGNYDTTMTLGSNTLTDPDSGALYVARLNRNTGSVIWGIRGGGTHQTTGLNITVDQNGGGIAIMGYFGVSTTLGPVTLNTTANAFYSTSFVAHIPNTILGVPSINKENTWTIYPNPSSSFLYINLADNNANHIVSICDAAGRVIQTTNTKEAVLKLNINNLSPGNYFVTIDNTQGLVETKQFVKQ